MKTKIQYDFKKDQFEVWSEVKKGKIKEVILEFLRTQMGLGKDERDPEKRDIYTITLDLDLSDDSFTVNSDTGNDSFMTGILRHFTWAINRDNDQVTIH